MSEAWLNFTIIIIIQSLLFVFYTYYEKKLSDIPHVLRLGILTGIIFGLLFDFILGKLFGLHSYALGFGVLFLILNSALSYGLFAATILLMQRARLIKFCVWTLIVTAVYEITNHFFHVWTWEFALSQVQFLIVLSVGYFAGAILIATVWHFFFGYRFLFIDNLLKK